MSAVDAIRAARLVAILRRVENVDARVAQLVSAGVRVVEITLDSEDALGAIERAGGRGGVTVLAGTVREPAQVDAAVAAGPPRSSRRRSPSPSSSVPLRSAS